MNPAPTPNPNTHTLWIGTARYEDLSPFCPERLELVRHGNHALWALQTNDNTCLRRPLVQAMTHDGDLIRGLAEGTPFDLQQPLAPIEPVTERPAESAFATRTDLREWLTSPIWARTLTTNDNQLVIRQTLTQAVMHCNGWSHADQQLQAEFNAIWEIETRLEATLVLTDLTHAREIARKPLLPGIDHPLHTHAMSA